jgi:hypothetical protein
MRWLALALTCALFATGLSVGSGLTLGQGKPAAGKAEENLTPEEKKEREQRKACKVAICSAFYARKPGADITCNILKTWRKEQISKVVGKGGLNWLWGNARCVSDIALKRDALIKAMSEPTYELVMDKHRMTCEIERDKEPTYTVKLEFQPKVTFKGGKAAKASMNWGPIDAPMMAKGALWSATGLDNSTGVLGATIVDDINDFIETKCLEVKSEWEGK